MTRILVVVAVTVLAAAIAYVLQRRRPAPAPVRTGYDVPEQLDRRDFARPDAPWLVAVFTSATCEVCADVWSKAQLLDSDDVAVEEIEYARDRRRHERYRIEAVPMVLVVDSDGVVRTSFLGPTSATHLWAGVARVRDPDSAPPGCGEH